MTPDQANTTVSDERLASMMYALSQPIGAAVLQGDDLADIRTALTELQRRRATADVTEAQVQAVAQLYGNYIEGHGWTGFGPTPAQILSALNPPMGR